MREEAVVGVVPTHWMHLPDPPVLYDRRDRVRNIWRGFLVGLASPLLWLNRKRIYWKLSFRYWRAKRQIARSN